ncbi:MAG: hypothetical protein PVJ09_01175 [Candidatus Woesebacteria bacterium]|jgi:hypothetical protein
MKNSNIYYPGKRSKRTVSSRLAKKEQKKLTQQTLIFAVLSLAILIIFLLVVMPAVIKLFFKIIDKGNNIDLGDQIPPQVPVIEAPVSATYSASIDLSGYAEADSEVVFVLNNQELDHVQVNEEGNFDYRLNLKSGDNELLLYGIDAAGNESVKTRTYNILMDNEEPKIELENPQDGAQIELKKNQLVEIKGKTESKAKVYINGRVVYAKSDGSFKTTYQLKEGENKLEIEAIDQASNKSKVVITVFFKF